MKAMVFRSKSGLIIEDVPAPEAAPGRVMLRVTNCGICGSDLFIYKNRIMPDGCIMGHEVSGVIETVGDGVSGIAPGDRVLIRPAGCGQCKHCAADNENLCSRRRSIGFGQVPGGFAEYMAVDADLIIPVPAALPLDQAALTDQVSTALHGLRVVHFKEGESALVLGAGPIGLCVIMILKQYGAGYVAASEMLEPRREQALKFGADAVVSPDELPKAMADMFGPDGADAIFECSGSAPATQQAINVAARGARIALVGMCSQSVSIIPMSLFQRQITIAGSFGNTQEECRECLDLMAEKKIPSGDLITEKIALEQVPARFDELLTSKTAIKVQTQMGPEM